MIDHMTTKRIMQTGIMNALILLGIIMIEKRLDLKKV